MAKTFDEIYSDMQETYRAETGMTINDTGDMAVRMRAAAAEIESLYIYSDWVMSQCFPQTATGEHLDSHAFMRGITRKPAVSAKGVIRFSRNTASAAAVPVPAGTVCVTASGTAFETDADAEIGAGQLYCDVECTAVEGGVSGNVSEKTVCFMTSAPVGVASCTNPERFTGGEDEEDDESLRSRILESYESMPNGGNAAWYQKQVTETEGVAGARVIPCARGTGTVDIIIASEDGVPTQELMDAVSEKLAEMREICVDINVLAPETVSVDVSVSVSVKKGYAVAAVLSAVEDALRAYFDGGILGESVLRAKLGSIVFAVPGVKNYAVHYPVSDVAVQDGQLPVLGDFMVWEMR